MPIDYTLAIEYDNISVETLRDSHLLHRWLKREREAGLRRNTEAGRYGSVTFPLPSLCWTSQTSILREKFRPVGFDTVRKASCVALECLRRCGSQRPKRGALGAELSALAKTASIFPAPDFGVPHKVSVENRSGLLDKNGSPYSGMVFCHDLSNLPPHRARGRK